MIIQPQFLFFPTVFLRLLLPLLAKSSMSELSTFEGRSKPRISSSSSFEFPENLFDLASLSIFLMLGHFFNSKTRKNLLHPFYKRQSLLPKLLKEIRKKINIAAKHSVFGIKWKLCHWGMRWARALYPGESRFLATANQRWPYNLGSSGHIALSEGFVFRAHCTTMG